jgi:hypothetical protein
MLCMNDRVDTRRFDEIPAEQRRDLRVARIDHVDSASAVYYLPKRHRRGRVGMTLALAPAAEE